MKKIFLMLICAFATLTVAAQNKISWNVELGLGASTWMGKDANGAKGLFNPKVGVGIDIPLTNLISFQSGLAWVSKGATRDINTDGYVSAYPWLSNVSDVTVNQNYFQMPLLAAFHLGTGSSFDVVLKTGAYIAVGVCGKSEFEYDDITMSWSSFGDSKVQNAEIPGLHRFDAGIVTGADLDFPSWYVGCDAEFGLCKIASGDSPHNFAFFVNVGYKF